MTVGETGCGGAVGAGDQVAHTVVAHLDAADGGQAGCAVPGQGPARGRREPPLQVVLITRGGGLGGVVVRKGFGAVADSRHGVQRRRQGHVRPDHLPCRIQGVSGIQEGPFPDADKTSRGIAVVTGVHPVGAIDGRQIAVGVIGEGHGGLGETVRDGLQETGGGIVGVRYRKAVIIGGDLQRL